MIQTITQLAETYFSEIQEIRRYFHANPELSTYEEKTATYIRQFLIKNKIEYKENIAGTGIVAYIKGKNPQQKCIALRADTDALPIEEQNEILYKSKNTGVMHACGHDAHMAILMGTIKILSELTDSFTGTISCLFQPSEETFPGGAIQMIQAGVLDEPKAEAILGLHVDPDIETGKIGLKPNAYMASTDEIYITVSGKGGHGAMPNKTTDTVLLASHIIVALQQIVSRNAPPHIPSVLSFGRIIGNGRTNIIPDKVTFDGTFRTFDETWRKKAHDRIVEIAENTAKSMHGNAKVKIAHGYPFLNNDAKLTGFVKTTAQELLGNTNVIDLQVRMTAEDFAYYAEKIPACFFRLGTQKHTGEFANGLHTSNFDIDENALITGTKIMAYAAIKLLTKNNPQ